MGIKLYLIGTLAGFMFAFALLADGPADQMLEEFDESFTRVLEQVILSAKNPSNKSLRTETLALTKERLLALSNGMSAVAEEHNRLVEKHNHSADKSERQDLKMKVAKLRDQYNAFKLERHEVRFSFYAEFPSFKMSDEAIKVQRKSLQSIYEKLKNEEIPKFSVADWGKMLAQQVFRLNDKNLTEADRASALEVGLTAYYHVIAISYLDSEYQGAYARLEKRQQSLEKVLKPVSAVFNLNLISGGKGLQFIIDQLGLQNQNAFELSVSVVTITEMAKSTGHKFIKVFSTDPRGLLSLSLKLNLDKFLAAFNQNSSVQSSVSSENVLLRVINLGFTTFPCSQIGRKQIMGF